MLWIFAALLGVAAVHGTVLAIHYRPSSRLLWHSGLLVLSTVIVTVIAATSTRREALLARARADFIASVSHELRMPLAQVLLASETLAEQRERSDAERVRLIQSIVREARRLSTLVDNVLLVARSGAVSLRPTMTSVPVAPLFEEVRDSVELAVQDAGQRLELGRVGDLAVRGDRQLLRQALLNLVDNASKYGPPGQPIRLSARKEASGKVSIAVEDEGAGVPPQLRRLVFQPYERLEVDQASERTGSGLGLAVVAQIARACGGTVRIEDAKPRGCLVVLTLEPASEEPAE